MADSSVVTRLVHRVRARHASTGGGLVPLRASLEAAPPGWALRVKGADVVVMARDGMPAPPAPVFVSISLDDPLVAMRLANPSARVALTAAEIVQDFDPVPMTLTVELVKKADGTPATGIALKAHGTGAAAVDLTEAAPGNGVYTTDERVWTSAFHPFELRIGATIVARLSMDFTRADTRVRVVDPT